MTLKAVKLIPVPSPNGTNKAQLYFKVQDMNLGDRRAFNIAEDEADPEGTNSARAVQGAASAYKPQEFAKGALSTNYFAEPAEDDDLDELPDEVVESLLAHARERGCSEEMLERLHMRLRGSQAEDADQPPNNVSGGQPQRGGSMTALKGRQTVNAEQRAMDSCAKQSFAARWPTAARISGVPMTNKRERAAPSLAMDRSRPGTAKSFAERHPNAARVKIL